MRHFHLDLTFGQPKVSKIAGLEPIFLLKILNCTYKIVGLDEIKLKSLSLQVVQDAESDFAIGTQLKYSTC